MLNRFYASSIPNWNHPSPRNPYIPKWQNGIWLSYLLVVDWKIQLISPVKLLSVSLIFWVDETSRLTVMFGLFNRVFIFRWTFCCFGRGKWTNKIEIKCVNLRVSRWFHRNLNCVCLSELKIHLKNFGQRN